MLIPHMTRQSYKQQLTDALIHDEKPSLTIKHLTVSGFTKKYFPELEALIHCKQDPDHHPEGDVFTHTMMVVDEVRKLKHHIPHDQQYGFMLSALLHDIGKASTTKQLDKKITSYDHDIVGSQMIDRIIGTAIDANQQTKHYVTLMTRYHMQPRWLYPHAKVKAFRKLAANMDGYIDDLLLLTQADTLGRGSTEPHDFAHYKTFFDTRMKELNTVPNKADKPLIDGDDLIQAGYSQGPLIGDILKQINRLEADHYSQQEIWLYIKTHY